MAKKKTAPPAEEDLFIPPPPPSPQFMRQAVLAYLAGQSPAGLALRVPARIRKYKADAAAFWVESQGKHNRLSRTVAVDIFRTRAECVPACADAAELMKELKELRRERIRLEAHIRETEPELAVSDELFTEFSSYHYASSRNSDYHKLLRRQGKIQHALFKGSRIEAVRQAGVADYLYMALPAGELEADELADGWGLLHVLPDGRIKVAKVAARQICCDESRLHLAFNIAMQAANNVLFANGVQLLGNGAIRFSRPPRRRCK